jgi:RNA polymerase sigma factor (sigma-70 family)
MFTTKHEPNPNLVRFFREISAFQPLSPARERKLAAQRDERARDELVRCNLAFVAMIAREFHPCSVPFEDLLHEGSLGLIEAARRFDASKNVKFITYARWWIRKEILRALGTQSTLVSIPDHRRRMLRRIRGERDSHERRLGRKLGWGEVGDLSSRTRAEVARILEAKHSVVSVHDAGNGEVPPLSERLADPGAASAEEELIRTELTQRMEDALSRLSGRQRRVLSGRFGLGGGPVLTLRELGAREGISRERTRQIERESLLRLRTLLRRRPARSDAGAGRYGSVTNERQPRVERAAC